MPDTPVGDRSPQPVSAGSDVLESMTVDVSHGGVAVRCDRPLPVDHRVLVVLAPGDRIIPVTGRVARSTPEEGIAAIEFIRLSPGPKRSLRRWLGPAEPDQGR